MLRLLVVVSTLVVSVIGAPPTVPKALANSSDASIDLSQKIPPQPKADGGIEAEFYNARHDKTFLWPNGTIPYFYDSPYTPQQVKEIRTAMDRIQENTCIVFIPWDNDTAKDYVAIVKGKGCGSGVAREWPPGPWRYVVTLADACIDQRTIEHELMHAIGLMHEQQRADRDQYIKVLDENIEPRMTYNFAIKDCADGFDTFGCPYTYESVMHYGKTDFGQVVSGVTQTTIVTLDEKYQDIIGSAKSGHPNDYEKINRMYTCDKEAAGHTCKKSYERCPGTGGDKMHH